ncbi:MAG: LPS-assembly protein LptD [Porticoccaceae bacterium]
MGWTKLGARKPLYTAVYGYLLATSGMVLTGYPLHADEVGNQWSCQASPSGDWQCGAAPLPGAPYSRPEARQTAVPVPAEEDAEPRLDDAARNLDWVPEAELSDAERALMRNNCCGAYVEPARNYPDAELEPDEASLRVSATTTEARGNVATLDGDVQVTQGYRQLRSDSAVVDQDARTVQLDGNINFREPGVLLTGDQARLDIDSGDADVDNATFLMHRSGVRGTAENLKKRDDNFIYVDNATYTTCEPGNNAWQLKAADIDIDTVRGVATAKHVRLEVKDWPLLYIPWIRFPVSDNRASGLLYPVIMAGNDNGIDYSQPLYLNLAPNYDATLTPRFVQERGAMLEAEFRHLNRWSETTVSGGYLWDDDGGDVSREVTASGSRLPYEGEDRWISSVAHEGGIGHRWSTLIDYTDVSDQDYFRDLGTATLEANSRSHLNQQLATGYSTDNWLFRLQAQEFETLIKGGLEQYKQLPRVDANGQYRMAGDLVVDLRQHYTVFDHSEDDLIGSGTFLTRDDENTTITGSRLRADYGLAWDKQWLWGFFKPGAKIKYAAYSLDTPLINQTDDSPDMMVPVASLDTGLYFERRGDGRYIQTIEPRLYYLKSEYEDQSAIPNFDTSDLTFSYQQLFRDDRFSGGDRIGDTQQVTFGVTSRLISAASGVEHLRFSIGQIHYQDERRVTLDPLLSDSLTRDTSDIAAELAATFWTHWRAQTDLLFNDEDGAINKGSAALRYNNREGTLFNLVYRYTRRDNLLYEFGSGTPLIDSVSADIDQLDASFSVPLSASWNLLGRYNQDLNSNQELEIFAGLEYSSCCWRAALVARRWIDRDDTLILATDNLDHRTGVFLQIQFKGLAGTGTRVNNILSEGIYGYQPPEP